MKKIFVLIISALAGLSLFSQAPTAEASDKNKSEEIQFYPNPAKDFVIITEPSHVIIYNIVGTAVVNANTIAKKEIIDLSNFPDALYFIQIDNGNLEKFTICRRS